MKTSLPFLAIGFGCVVGVGSHLFLSAEAGGPSAEAARPAEPLAPDRIAANGVVEGARPEVALRMEVTGVIAAVFFRENREVKRGDLLVELRNESQKEQVALATAEVAIARADLERLRNGERKEKRQAVAAVEKARQTIYKQAETEWQRARKMRGGSLSAEQYDADYFKMLRAKADLEEAAAERTLVEAPPRAEDVAAAEGRVAAAEARLRLAQADLAKTRLLAPSSGRILQVYVEPGELATPNSAQPILLMGDLSRRRVRAFVEELDLSRVALGQKAVVTADGFPGREFSGKVGLIVPRMGKRAPLTDNPGEYKDVYFREVLIDLDQASELPTNLRVHALICPEK